MKPVRLAFACPRGHLCSVPGLRQAFVVCEVALALVLLVGAGLLIRSFAYLRGVWLTALGLGAGVVLALLLGRALTALLYGTRGSDPVTLARLSFSRPSQFWRATCRPVARRE